MMTLAMLALLTLAPPDEDGGDRRECHLERGGVDLDEAEPLLIDEDADRAQPGGKDDGNEAHLVDADARCLGKGRVGADGGHRGAGLGVQDAHIRKARIAKKIRLPVGMTRLMPKRLRSMERMSASTRS